METKSCYKEILKLERLLKEAGVPCILNSMFDGYQLLIPDKDAGKDCLCDAIQHFGSYGHDEDLLEIMGGLTEDENEDDSVLGYLTAEEVFKRFKYCYENNTNIYKE